MEIEKCFCSPISIFLVIAVMALTAPTTGEQPSGVEINPDGESKIIWIFDTPESEWHVTGGHGSFVSGNPYGHCGDDYYAIDLARLDHNQEGQPIYPAISGIVYMFDYENAWGKEVIIYDPDSKFALRYAHLREYDESLNGKWISATSNIPLGKVGHSGPYDTGPHLHLVLYKNVNSIEKGYPVSISSCSVQDEVCVKSATEHAAKFSFIPRANTEGSESQPDISKGLVAYYPFDGDANDASGNGNHGMLNGGARFVSAVKGMGLKLGGVHSPGGTANPDYVLVKNSPSLQFNDSMTISYFVKIDGTQAQTGADCSGRIIDEIYGNILGKSGDRTGFYFLERNTQSEFGIDAWKGGIYINSGSDLLPSILNNFRHVVYTIDGTTIHLYVDGVLKNTIAPTVSFDDANTQDMYIGVQNDESGSCLKYWYPLEGTIDELRIYNRVLNHVEISQLFKYAS
jgi:hypothetical protein